jgi:hypothetical protein
MILWEKYTLAPEVLPKTVGGYYDRKGTNKKLK